MDMIVEIEPRFSLEVMQEMYQRGLEVSSKFVAGAGDIIQSLVEKSEKQNEQT